MTISLAEIRRSEIIRSATPTRLVTDNPPPVIPTAPTVTGQQGLLRVQWVTVLGVEGYDVAIMASPNLAAPDINIVRVVGEKNREYTYVTGNVAITRYFAVRSYIGGYFSAWSQMVSGTSTVFGTPESAPPVSPVTPPSADEPPPSGLGGPRRFNTL